MPTTTVLGATPPLPIISLLRIMLGAGLPLPGPLRWGHRSHPPASYAMPYPCPDLPYLPPDKRRTMQVDIARNENTR